MVLDWLRIVKLGAVTAFGRYDCARLNPAVDPFRQVCVRILFLAFRLTIKHRARGSPVAVDKMRSPPKLRRRPARTFRRTHLEIVIRTEGSPKALGSRLFPDFGRHSQIR